MQNALTVAALALAVVAAGVAGYALSQNRELRQELEAQALLASHDASSDEPGASVSERLEAVERRLERVDEAVGTGRTKGGVPTLEGRSVFDVSPLREDDPTGAGEEAAVPEHALKALVDEAVERKALQMQQMKNKKPTLGAFAEVLALSDAQQVAVKDEVIRGQREIWNLLETPTDDGSVFMDELVEIMADNMAHPGQDPEAGKRFFQRVIAERFPGTDETYAARIEAVKATVRAGLKRDLSAAQYALFEAWQLDPIEIHGIEGSPRSALYARIKDRARQLGADLPEDR